MLVVRLEALVAAKMRSDEALRLPPERVLAPVSVLLKLLPDQLALAFPVQ